MLRFCAYARAPHCTTIFSFTSAVPRVEFDIRVAGKLDLGPLQNPIQCETKRSCGKKLSVARIFKSETFLLEISLISQNRLLLKAILQVYAENLSGRIMELYIKRMH